MRLITGVAALAKDKDDFAIMRRLRLARGRPYLPFGVAEDRVFWRPARYLNPDRRHATIGYCS